MCTFFVPPHCSEYGVFQIARRKSRHVVVCILSWEVMTTGKPSVVCVQSSTDRKENHSIDGGTLIVNVTVEVPRLSVAVFALICELLYVGRYASAHVRAVFW